MNRDFGFASTALPAMTEEESDCRSRVLKTALLRYGGSSPQFRGARGLEPVRFFSAGRDLFCGKGIFFLGALSSYNKRGTLHTRWILWIEGLGILQGLSLCGLAALDIACWGS